MKAEASFQDLENIATRTIAPPPETEWEEHAPGNYEEQRMTASALKIDGKALPQKGQGRATDGEALVPTEQVQ